MPFLKVADNAFGKALTGALDNTTAVMSFSINPGEGARFPESGDFLVTISDGNLSPDNPFEDPFMEVATCTGRATDLLSLSRNDPKVHAGAPWVQLLVMARHIQEIQDAVTAIEGQSHYGVEPVGIAEGASVLTLPDAPSAGTERGYRNGGRMRRGEGYDYTISGAEITLSVPIQNPDERIIFDYDL